MLKYAGRRVLWLGLLSLCIGLDAPYEGSARQPSPTSCQQSARRIQYQELIESVTKQLLSDSPVADSSRSLLKQCQPARFVQYQEWMELVTQRLLSDSPVADWWRRLEQLHKEAELLAEHVRQVKRLDAQARAFLVKVLASSDVWVNAQAMPVLQALVEVNPDCREYVRLILQLKEGQAVQADERAFWRAVRLHLLPGD